MNQYPDFLHYMKSYPLWDDVEEFLVEHRPIVPTYDPSEDNTALWKHQCAEREGFDILLKLLKIEVE